MNITINVIEVASDLAHNAMYAEVTSPLYDGSAVLQEEDLYNYDEEGNSTYKEEYQDVFNRHYDYFFDYFFEMMTNKMDTTYFPVTHTCREELEGIGFDTSKVDDDTMTRLASKLEEDYCEQLYWSSLPIIAEHLKIPKHKKNGKSN